MERDSCRRQRRLKLEPRGLGGRSQSEARQELRRMRSKQGLNLACRQSRQFRLISIDESPAAARAAIRHDRHTRGTERIHVSEHRPLGDLQALRQVARS
jgi:hypothetical protein